MLIEDAEPYALVESRADPRPQWDDVLVKADGSRWHVKAALS